MGPRRRATCSTVRMDRRGRTVTSGSSMRECGRCSKCLRDFVLHSLRHTFGTRLGESGADAFTIMRLMGHSTVTVSQRYVHPSPEALELAYERMTAMNLRRLPTNSPIVGRGDVAVAS